MTPKERKAKSALGRLIKTRKSLELSIEALAKLRETYQPDTHFYKQFSVAIQIMDETRHDLRKHLDIVHDIVNEGGAQ